MTGISKTKARPQIAPPEEWTPTVRGRALHVVFVLASTEPSEWRSKKEIHAGIIEILKRTNNDVAADLFAERNGLTRIPITGLVDGK